MQLHSASFYKSLQKLSSDSPGSTFLLAVSGGVDSMVMLDLFIHLRSRKNLTFKVAHIDHTVREDSHIDAQFVTAYCADHEVECIVKQVNVPAEMEKSGDSIEMCARRLRYQALESIAASQQLDFICTAHNANDEAETILMRILSGTGVTGLQGIRPQRGRIYRPLLRFTRQQIESHAAHYEVPYREDKTNTDLSILRNRIRHSLIPLLEQEYNPAVVDALNRLSVVQTEVQNMLDQKALQAKSDVVIRQSSGEIMLDIQGLRAYFTAIQKAIIFNCLNELTSVESQPNYQQTEQLMSMIQSAESGTEMPLPGDIQAVVDRNFLYFTTMKFREPFTRPFRSSGTVSAGRFSISVESLEDVTETVPRDSNEMAAYFDAALLNSSDLTWRNWKAGDLLRLSNGKMKKVSDIWIDQKVPVWDKYTIPLLAEGAEVLWIPGHKRSGRAWISKETTTMYKMTAEKVT